ncbi:MAG: hypothetical protein ACYC96_02885 [Fimbriimonadaceae bacterium]
MANSINASAPSHVGVPRNFVPAHWPGTVATPTPENFNGAYYMFEDRRVNKMVMIALSLVASLISSALYWLLTGGR